MADFSRELWFASERSDEKQNIRMHQLRCERSDAIYERSDTNREQWFRIRIPKSEVSGDGPLRTYSFLSKYINRSNCSVFGLKSR